MRKKLLFMLFIVGLIFTTSCGISANKQKKETDEWALSGTYKDKDGRIFIGEKEKLSILLPSSGKFIKDTPDKYMWLFWGKEQELENKKLKVLAIQKDNEKQEPIFLQSNDNPVKSTSPAGSLIVGKIHSADAHLPTLMSFSQSGIWKLRVYIDKKLIDTLVINVKDK
ncbi:MAG: DUF4871 domain-containing protein [Bacillus sp. (in: firmicutes)]